MTFVSKVRCPSGTSAGRTSKAATRSNQTNGGQLKGKNGNGTSLERGGFEKALWTAVERFRGNVPPPEFRELVLGLVLLKNICRAFELHRRHLDTILRDVSSKHYLSTEHERQVSMNVAATYRDAGVFFVPLYATWQRIEAAAAQRPERLPQLLEVAMSAVEHENPELADLLPKHYARSGLSVHNLAELVRVVSELCDREQAGEPIALAQLTRAAAESFGSGRTAARGSHSSGEHVRAKAGEVIARFDEKLSKFDGVLKELRAQLRQRKL